MASRLKLHELLVRELGTDNVYFQPPESKKLNYPCICYELDGIEAVRADDQIYTNNRNYSMTYITRDPDDALIDRLAKLPLCRMSNTYYTQGINHYVYEIYY